MIRANKAKRVAIAAQNIATEAEIEINTVEKSVNVLKTIYKAIESNLLFDIHDEARAALIASMTPLPEVEKDTIIINQGDKEANAFYVLEAGSCDAYVEDASGKSILVKSYSPGSGFGELALLYDAPRAATVKSTSNCKLWVLYRKVYMAVKRTYDQKLFKEKIELLSAVPILSSLNEDQQETIADALELIDFEEGDVIFKKGQVGDRFYMIKEGSVKITNPDNSDELLTELSVGGYFGERALMQDETRAATVTTSAYCRCYSLNRTAFHELLGPLEDIWRLDALKDVSILQSLKISQLKKLASELVNRTFEAGEVIFNKGDVGEDFYIVERGDFDVIGDNETVLAKLSKGACFGELALLKNDTRAATVKAVTAGRCLSLSRENFNKRLGTLEEIQHMWRYEALRKVPILSKLTKTQRNKLVLVMQERTYQDGEVIIKQGEKGDIFYIMMHGEVSVTASGVEVTKIGAGGFFGELALLKEDVRQATVSAIGEVSVMFLDRNHFNMHLGSLQDIMQTQAVSYDAVTESKLAQSTQLSDFQPVATLGIGAFGKVLLVKFGEKRYALKCLQKSQIISMGLLTHVKREKDIMMECHSPFLVNLVACFKDKTQLYMLMECVMGGELFTYLQSLDDPISEEDAKFYAGCVVLAFEYLQDRNLLYRDLKPENLLIDRDGYIKVADFGFAKELKSGKTYTMCGTPDYLAPELVQQTGHNKAADWWALGVLLYEMVTGLPPFYEEDQVALFRNICNLKYSFPRHLSKDCRDLIKRLLTKNPARRLGNLKGGAQDVKEHPWFKGLDWVKLARKEIPAPYVPQIGGVDDVSNFEDIPLDEEHPGEGYSNKPYRSIGQFKEW